jgi:hypothetical protein
MREVTAARPVIKVTDSRVSSQKFVAPPKPAPFRHRKYEIESEIFGEDGDLLVHLEAWRVLG